MKSRIKGITADIAAKIRKRFFIATLIFFLKLGSIFLNSAQ
jgi:hypothetical protein